MTTDSIPGIDELTVLRYFQTLNAGDFEATAQLFAPQGAMQPPFEEPIVGREAIAAFLKAEAQGMRLEPREGVAEMDNGQTQVQVGGKVQTALFGVNVAWYFTLSAFSDSREKRIVFVRVKLLASPQELLKLRDDKSKRAQ